MSNSITPFLKDVAFDPESMRAMDLAFDQVCGQMRDRGQPSVVLEVLARRIVEIAETGERDPDRIAQRALIALGLDRGV